MPSDTPWTPFERASFTEAQLLMNPALAQDQVFQNSRYQVNVRTWTDPDLGRMAELSIKRRDKEAIHDWRELQRVKNEIAGPSYDAVELYPAEDRLTDTANQYYLFVFFDIRMPFGFQTRHVSETPWGHSKQRPFEADNRPPDLDAGPEQP